MAVLHFGTNALDLGRHCLRTAAGEVPLRLKSFEVLRYLLERSFSTVSRTELLNSIWIDVTVNEESVTRCIYEIRKALDDAEQRIIRTVAGVGYMVNVEVRREETAPPGLDTPPPQRSVADPGSVASQPPRQPAGADAASPLGERRVTPHAEVEPSPSITPDAGARPAVTPIALRGGSEKRTVTIVNCDLVDLMVYSSRLETEDLQALISGFHETVRKVVEREGCVLTLPTPTGVTCVFGFPTSDEHDAERAVRAALAAVGAVAAAKPPASSPVPLQARIGVATGVVVVGEAGGAGGPSVVGEATVIAARLAAIASPGSVVVGANTRTQLADLFEYRQPDEDAARALGDFEAWLAVRESPIASRFDALQRSSGSPLVGRDDHLATLLRLWDQAAAGNGRVVHIRAEPGVGKSRLVQALLDGLAAKPHARLRYFCSPNHTNSALHPVLTQIAEAAGIDRTDDGPRRLAKLEALLRTSSSDIAGMVPLLAPRMSIPLGDAYRASTLSPRRGLERLFEDFIQRLVNVASRTPVLIVLEDAHWIDPTSLELLTLLIDRVRSLRALLIITARPSFNRSWPILSHVSTMEFGRLDEHETAALAQNLVGGKRLPAELLSEIERLTDGVPLFIEELVKSVVASGVLTEAGDAYALSKPLPVLSIPSSLHASLMARLDALGDVKHVAQAAAVIGREFPYGLIAALTGLPEEELDPVLDRLVGAGIVFRRGLPPDSVYHFTHAMLRDEAYQSLLRGNRRELHKVLATRLAARAAEDDVDPALIALHSAEAGLHAGAIRQYMAAGKRSSARSALSEAAALFDRALEQVYQLPEGQERDALELEVHSERGAALLAVRGYGALETGRAFSRAKELWEKLGKPTASIRVARGLWLYHIVRAEYPRARAIAEDVLAVSTRHGDVEGQVLSSHCLGTLEMLRGEFAAARVKIEQTLHFYGEQADGQSFRHHVGYGPNVLGLALRGMMLAWIGYPDQARECAIEALSRARRLGQPPDVAACLSCAARIPAATDAELAAWLAELDALVEQHGYPYWLAQAMMIRGEVELRRGDAEAAVRSVKQGIAAQSAGGAALWSTHTVLQLARAQEASGRPQEALHVIDAELDTIEHTGERWGEAELHRHRGLLQSKLGRPEAAEAELRRALAIAQRQGARFWELRAATALAGLLGAAGRKAEARDILAPVFAWFTEGFDTSDLVAARALLDQLGG